MNSDRELLELAAKAAGYTCGKFYEETDGVHDAWLEIESQSFSSWNPLANDCEAQRLAVKLRLKIYHGEFCVVAQCKLGNYFGDEPYGDDKYAATRRAIVRAAAEIGKTI